MPQKTKTPTQFRDRETATILAALRYWQRRALLGPPTALARLSEWDVATDGNTLEPLTAAEIDVLCEAINFAEDELPPAVYVAAPELLAALKKIREMGYNSQAARATDTVLACIRVAEEAIAAAEKCQ